MRKSWLLFGLALSLALPRAAPAAASRVPQDTAPPEATLDAVVNPSCGETPTTATQCPPSSARFKADIADMGDASDRLMALRPLTLRHSPAPGEDSSRPGGLPFRRRAVLT